MARFDDLMRRLFEAGLVNLWIQDYSRDFLFALKESLNHTSDEPMNNHDVANRKAWTSKKIVFQLTIWYCVCIIIFLCEIIWSRFKTKSTTQKRTYERFKRPKKGREVKMFPYINVQKTHRNVCKK